MILGASFDSVEANHAFNEKFCYPYKLLSFDEETGKAYDAGAPPYAKRISYLIGPDRRVVKAYPKVKPSEHPAEVLADIPT